jgi:hypothetical protein
MSQNRSLKLPIGRAVLPRPAQEETLITDPRAGMTPSQFVERKLMGVLRGGPLPVSHLTNALRGRRPR